MRYIDRGPYRTWLAHPAEVTCIPGKFTEILEAGFPQNDDFKAVELDMKIHEKSPLKTKRAPTVEPTPLGFGSRSGLGRD